MTHTADSPAVSAQPVIDWIGGHDATRPASPTTLRNSPRDVLGASLWKLKRAPRPGVTITGSPQFIDEPPIPTEPTTERRLYPRCPTFGQVSIAPWPTNADYHSQIADALLRESGIAGELLNLSQNGLAIAVLQKFVTTEILIARLISAERGLHYDTLCRVVRCKPIGDGRWQIVARFPLEIPFNVAYQLSDHDPRLTGTPLE